MSAQGMTATILAGMLAEAVAKDETPEAGGCDVSAGMFGPHASDLLRKLAGVITTAHAVTRLHGHYPVMDDLREALGKLQ